MSVTAGIVGFADPNNAGQEGPHLVRLREADLKQRINGQLTLRYEAGGLTSFAGLELIGRFFRRLDFKGALRGAGEALPRSDFGSVPMVLLVLTMLITGARRVRHVGHLQDDPLVRRECGLSRIPIWHTVGHWLRGFDDRGVTALLKVTERRRTNRKRRALRTFRIIHTLRHQFINRAGLLVQPNGRWTLDVGNNRNIGDGFQTIEQALSG